MRINFDLRNRMQTHIGESKHEKLRFAMTLSEVLIAVVIIGCLVILLIPMCKKLQPDKNEALHKKATFIVNKVVNELATDESLYANNEEYTGLSNTNKVTINGEDHEGSTKFCTLFASRLNLAPNSTVNCKADEKTLTTNDGMDWYLPISEFKESEYERIKVDVNGSKGPNCSYNESTCKDPDQFIYKIRKGEKVYKTGTQYYEETNGPSGHTVASATNNIVEEEKTGEKTYSITCSISGPGTVYGTGSNKPNGTYHLVAIPQPGYKGNWFTKNVTVKNADITEGECSVTFTPINLGCREDGGCEEPEDPENPTPPGDDDDDDDDDTEEEAGICVYANITGDDPSKCSVSGADTSGGTCSRKKGDSYALTAHVQEGYKPHWVDSGQGTADQWDGGRFLSGFVPDHSITETLECNKEETEKCYTITVTGDTENCPVTLPAGNCKADKTKYTLGSYEYTVKPKEGYVYEKSADTVSKKVWVTGDTTINIDKCELGGKKYNVTLTLLPSSQSEYNYFKLNATGILGTESNSISLTTQGSNSSSGGFYNLSSAQDFKLSGLSTQASTNGSFNAANGTAPAYCNVDSSGNSLSTYRSISSVNFGKLTSDKSVSCCWGSSDCNGASNPTTPPVSPPTQHSVDIIVKHTDSQGGNNVDYITTTRTTSVSVSGANGVSPTGSINATCIDIHSVDGGVTTTSSPYQCVINKTFSTSQSASYLINEIFVNNHLTMDENHKTMENFTCTLNLFGRTVSCNSNSSFTINNVTYNIKVQY